MMFYISDDEYRQMDVNHTSNKIDDLSKKVDILVMQVNSLQKQVNQIIRNTKVKNESNN